MNYVNVHKGVDFLKVPRTSLFLVLIGVGDWFTPNWRRFLTHNIPHTTVSDRFGLRLHQLPVKDVEISQSFAYDNYSRIEGERVYIVVEGKRELNKIIKRVRLWNDKLVCKYIINDKLYIDDDAHTTFKFVSNVPKEILDVGQT